MTEQPAAVVGVLPRRQKADLPRLQSVLPPAPAHPPLLPVSRRLRRRYPDDHHLLRLPAAFLRGLGCGGREVGAQARLPHCQIRDPADPSQGIERRGRVLETCFALAARSILIDRVTIVALLAKVSSWKESATREEAKRLAIKKEKERIEQFLHAKTEVKPFCLPIVNHLVTLSDAVCSKLKVVLGTE